MTLIYINGTKHRTGERVLSYMDILYMADIDIKEEYKIIIEWFDPIYKCIERRNLEYMGITKVMRDMRIFTTNKKMINGGI